MHVFMDNDYEIKSSNHNNNNNNIAIPFWNKK